MRLLQILLLVPALATNFAPQESHLGKPTQIFRTVENGVEIISYHYPVTVKSEHGLGLSLGIPGQNNIMMVNKQPANSPGPTSLPRPVVYQKTVKPATASGSDSHTEENSLTYKYVTNTHNNFVNPGAIGLPSFTSSQLSFDPFMKGPTQKYKLFAQTLQNPSQIISSGFKSGKYYDNNLLVSSGEPHLHYPGAGTAAAVGPEPQLSKGDNIPIQVLGTADYGPVNYGVPQFHTPSVPDTYQYPANNEMNQQVLSMIGKDAIKETMKRLSLDPEEKSRVSESGVTQYKAMFDLGNLRVFPEGITLSGLSSGGGLAQQLLVAHASIFSGIAVFQQTFYRCGTGNGDVVEFDNLCTNLVPNNQSRMMMGPGSSESYDPQRAINDIRSYAQHGLIDNPQHLLNKRLYVYAGLHNPIFKPEMMLNVITVLEPFIKNPYAIKARVQNAAYFLPTSTMGLPCSQQANNNNHLLGNCENLNGPYDALSFLLGKDKIKLPQEGDVAHPESLLEFDQYEFFHGITTARHSMAKSGYLYVPKKCGPSLSQNKCLLHIYFHGCGAGSDITDGQHILRSGFLELAELNNLIILFPQIERDELNELGCWDSYGYSGPLYATQKGAQVIIIRNMISRLLGNSESENTVVDGNHLELDWIS